VVQGVLGLSGEVKETRSTPKEWAFSATSSREGAARRPDARSHPYFQSEPAREGRGDRQLPRSSPHHARGEVLGTLCINRLEAAGDQRGGSGGPRTLARASPESSRCIRGVAQGRQDHEARSGAPPSDLEVTLAYLDSAILLVDADRRVLFVSPSFDELFERPASNATAARVTSSWSVLGLLRRPRRLPEAHPRGRRRTLLGPRDFA